MRSRMRNDVCDWGVRRGAPVQPDPPPEIRIAIVLDDFSPHVTTKKDARVGDWAAAGNVESAYTPTNSSWPHRIEARPSSPPCATSRWTAPGHASHNGTAQHVRRYIIWRNKPTTTDIRLHTLVTRVNVA